MKKVISKKILILMSLMLFLLLFVGCFITPNGVTGVVRNLTKGTDYNIIQAAINDADSNNIIEVSPGTYYENIDFNGKNITLRSTNPNNSDIVASTIINGGWNGSVVTFSSGEGTGAVIQGFTITNGSGTEEEPDWICGGGIYVLNSSPTIIGNTISKNSVDLVGGGIYMRYSSSNITGNTIIENSAVRCDGGGISMLNSSPTITGNTISRNTASGGGGIDVHLYSSPTISENTISENSAVVAGGIRVGVDSSPTISGNTISGNTAEEVGGGIAIWHSSPTISGNTINNNSTIIGYAGTGDGGGIYMYNSSSTISGNTISENSALANGGGIYVSSNSYVRTTAGTDWPRNNKPPNEENTNTYSGNIHGDSPGYTEGADVYFKTVSESNHPPVITSTTVTSATKNEPYSYNVDATDSDGDTLTYFLTIKPTGMTINAATGLINWTPTATGDYNVTVKVSDGELFTTQSFTVTVEETGTSLVQVQLSSPSNGVTLPPGYITFSWNPVSNATKYQFILYNSLGQVALDWIDSNTLCTVDLAIEEIITWKIRAGDNSGNWGAWSSTWNLTIKSTTLDNQPGAATFSNVTETSIQANWTANGNPAGIQYYCENTTKGTNSSWTTNLYWNSTGMSDCTTYHFRVKAKNGDGIETGWTDLGNQKTIGCTSLQVTTNNASSITSTSAQLNGNLDSTGGLSCEVWFEYGKTISYGSSITKQSKSSTGPLNQAISSLDSNTTYHFKACASNTEGTVYGDDKTFTPPLPDTSRNLKLTPATQSVAIGTEGTVNVVVEDVTALMAASITLNFDAAKLQYVSSAPGDFFSSAFIVSATPGSGSVTIDMMSLAEKPSGTGTILTVVFERIAAGTTNITFGATELTNEDGFSITHTKGSGCSVTDS